MDSWIKIVYVRRAFRLKGLPVTLELQKLKSPNKSTRLKSNEELKFRQVLQSKETWSKFAKAIKQLGISNQM